jgi:hypothetical protein
MAKETNIKGFLKLFVRGVLGGIVGSLVVAAAVVCLIRPTGWDNWLGYFILIFIVSFPFGVVAGATLAGTLWVLNWQFGIHLGLLPRVLCGTAIGIIIIGIWWVMTSNPYKQSYETNSWTVGVWGLVLLGAAFGAIPGMLIGSRREKKRDSNANK